MNPFYSSTNTAFAPSIQLLNYCAKSNNKPTSEIILAILCDLFKAIDVISHELFLNKLNTYGIRGNANNWFKSYLADRSQFVDVDVLNSIRKKINLTNCADPVIYTAVYQHHSSNI